MNYRAQIDALPPKPVPIGYVCVDFSDHPDGWGKFEPHDPGQYGAQPRAGWLAVYGAEALAAVRARLAAVGRMVAEPHANDCGSWIQNGFRHCTCGKDAALAEVLGQ